MMLIAKPISSIMELRRGWLLLILFGIVSRTDEANKLGVGMAAPYYQNKDVIEKNDVTVFSSNYNLYGDLSARVMDTLRLDPLTIRQGRIRIAMEL